MGTIHIFPQWNEQNKDYFVDTKEYPPIHVVCDSHPFYKEGFLSAHIKPGVVPNLFVLCRPKGHWWGAWDAIRPELKIGTLVLEVTENGNKHFGEVLVYNNSDETTHIELNPQGGRKWGINGHIHHSDGFPIFFLTDQPKKLLNGTTINDIPLNIRFDSRDWTLEFYPTTMDNLNAKIVGITFVIEMDSIKE